MTKDNNSQEIKDQDLEKISGGRVDIENIAKVGVAIELDDSQLVAAAGGRGEEKYIEQERRLKEIQGEGTQTQEQQSTVVNHEDLLKEKTPVYLKKRR